MTVLDIAFLLCLGAFMILGFKRGMIKTLFGFASNVIGIFLAYMIYPYVSAFLIKETGLKGSIQNKIVHSLKLDALLSDVVGRQAQEAAMNQLPIPEIFKKMLIENNNDEVYRLLDTNSLQDYISGTLATIVINAIGFLVVAILVMLAVSLLSGTLDILAKLPIVSQLNQMGGLMVGTLWGVVVLWCGGLLILFMAGIQKNGQLMALLERSPITLFFFENNLLMHYVSDFTKTLIK